LAGRGEKVVLKEGIGRTINRCEAWRGEAKAKSGHRGCGGKKLKTWKVRASKKKCSLP